MIEANVLSFEECGQDAHAPLQLELPLHSWDEGMELAAKDGTKLERWGSVAQMSKLLFKLDRDACYLLLEDSEVDGFKQGAASNSHWRVDLLSAWEYRQRSYGR